MLACHIFFHSFVLTFIFKTKYFIYIFLIETMLLDHIFYLPCQLYLLNDVLRPLAFKIVIDILELKPVILSFCFLFIPSTSHSYVSFFLFFVG